jgi:hypothetical protein
MFCAFAPPSDDKGVPRVGEIHDLALASTDNIATRRQRRRCDAALHEAIDRGEDLGVIRRDEPCYTEWIGTKADLIAANVCTEGHFPVGRARLLEGEAGEGRNVAWWRTRAIRNGYWRHLVELRAERGEQLARESGSCTDEVGTPIHDAGEFTDYCESVFMRVREVMVGMILGGDSWRGLNTIRR